MTYCTTVEQVIEQATQHFTQRQYGQADALCRQALGAEPHNALALNLAGLLAVERGEYVAAEVFFRDAIAHTHALDCIYNNLGIALSHQGRLAEALECYQTVAAHIPKAALPQSNIGHTLLRLGRVREALHHYERAIALDPQTPGIRENYALALLLAGRFAEGWAAYEHRRKPLVGRYPQPIWNGEPLAGKRIVLHAEQGLGDTIQFLRYIPLVQNRGGQVILHCQREIRPLLADWRAITVVADGEPLPEFDLQQWLMSMPHLFETTLETIPTQVPYLHANQRKTEAWRERLERYGGLKVGIAWAGSKSNVADAERSIPLDTLRPMLTTQGVTFVSLQKGRSIESPMGSSNSQWINWTDELCDFSDTAALINNLDLVISVDTSVAHLAGALGKTVWTMVQFAPDFRWMLERQDTPWYPTMRLFRQHAMNDWAHVVAAVSKALMEAVEKRVRGPIKT